MGMPCRHVLAINSQQFGLEDFDVHWTTALSAGHIDRLVPSLCQVEGALLRATTNMRDHSSNNNDTTDECNNRKSVGEAEDNTSRSETNSPTPSLDETSNTTAANPADQTRIDKTQLYHVNHDLMLDLQRMAGDNVQYQQQLHCLLQSIVSQLTTFITHNIQQSRSDSLSGIGLRLNDPVTAPRSIGGRVSAKRTKASFESFIGRVRETTGTGK